MSADTDPRKTFLLEMYRQTSAHLNRHILLSWQSVGVVGGALVVFVLGDKAGSLSDARLDFVIGIVALLCAWAVAHVYDANNWFERNLHIITNIERQFLTAKDRSEIHYFFTEHRRARAKNWLVAHLRIQRAMIFCLWAMVVAYHFYLRVYPGFKSSLDQLEVVRGVPYLITVIALWYCSRVAADRKRDYEALLAASPGKAVE